MLRPPVTPKKRTPPVPEQPEIPAAWLEALNNSGTTVAPANAGTVSPRKQFTNIRQAEQAIDSRQQAEANYNAYYDERVPVRYGDVYSRSAKALAGVGFRHGIQYPIESLNRTLTFQNAPTYLNPFNGASTSKRLGALGEDTLNLAGIIPGVRAVAQGAPEAAAGFRTAKNQLATRMGQKFAAPTANLDNYLLHGGPHPRYIEGGVLDPNYVRGGDLYLRKGEGLPSVADGPNAMQQREILENAQAAEDAIAGRFTQGGKGGRFRIYEDPAQINASSAEQLAKRNTAEQAKAKEWLETNKEIIARVRAGESHQTGVSWQTPSMAYRHGPLDAGMHLIDVPPGLQTTDVTAPAGEVVFWGAHKPVGFVKSNTGVGTTGLEDRAIRQIMLDDADLKSMSKQKLANMIARVRGTKITPAYKSYAQDVFDQYLGGTMSRYDKNPNFGQPREILEYIQRFPSELIPKITNYDQIVSGIQNAKTEKEILNLVDEIIPEEQLDYVLRQQLQRKPGGIDQVKREIINQLVGFNTGYSRLKSVPRNGPIIEQATRPAGLANWDSLIDPEDSGLYAFADNFMDRRTPAEVVKQVYDPELFRMMVNDPQQGQRIINERLSQLRRNQ
jgi:hypothetical protein